MPKPVKTTAHDPKILLQRISDNFPDIHWSSYKYIDDGWDHEILILDQDLVFRFPNNKEYLKLLENEIKVLKQLTPIVSIKIPNYIYIAPDYSFAGYQIVPGTPLLKELFNRLSPSDRNKVAEQLASFLSTIHTLEEQGRDLSSVAKSDMPETQQHLREQAERHLKGVLDKNEYVIVQEILDDVDMLLKKELPRAFIHGDVYHNHLLWDEATSQLGIIDFSDMNLGDPAFDFAELYEYGDDFVREVYDYYQGPKDQTFLKRAWAYQRWVAVYMMVNYFDTHKISFEKAKETFDRVKNI